MTEEHNLVSTQEMNELLKILSGQAVVIVNPDKLDGVYKDVDIYGLAALLVGLRKLIMEHSQLTIEAMAEIHERIDALEAK